MAYNLDSKGLVEYLYKRISEPIYHKHVTIEENSLVLEVCKGKICVIPEIKDAKIEFKIDAVPHFGERELFSSFLEKAVNNDDIFMRGNHLYSERREKFLPRWRAILKRIPENGEKGKMSCEIINREISTHRLRIAIYEYQMRPLLYFLFVHSRKNRSD